MQRSLETGRSLEDGVKSVLTWTGAAVFGVIGFDVASEMGLGFAGKVASVIGGAFVGKKLTENVVK